MIKGLLISVLGLGLALAAAFFWFEANVQKTNGRFEQARADFLLESGAAGCLSKLAIQTTAERRGWRIDADPDGFGPGSLGPAASVLVVHIQPRQPFAKLPGTVLRFDADGCLLAG